MPAKTRLLWAVLNLLGLIWALTWNGLANALPLNGLGTGEISDLNPSLFVPAGVTFSIWGLIYLALMGFVGAGFVFARRDDGGPLPAIGPWFLVNTLANGAWIVAWHWQQLLLSVVLMLVILGSLIAMYVRLGIGRGLPSDFEVWTVHRPISLYLGWISVATIANVTALVVDLGVPAWGTGSAVLASGMVAVAVVLALRMLWAHRDVVFASVIVWALLGIALARWKGHEAGASIVEEAALVGAMLVAAGAVLSGIRSPFEHG
jgi:hypothetical protein